MRKIFLVFLTTIIFGLFIQVVSAQSNVKEEKAALKPLAYDSTKTFAEQFKSESKYRFLGLQMLLPPVIDPQAGPIVFSKPNADFVKGGKRYTITGILEGNVLEELKKKELACISGFRYKDLNSLLWKGMIIHVVFILKENIKKDSTDSAPPLYWVVSESKIAPYSCSSFNAFVPMPYFHKQKSKFEKKTVVMLNDKSVWVCRDVRYMKAKGNEKQDCGYDIFCTLTDSKKIDNKKTDSKQKAITLRPLADKNGRIFMTQQEYDLLDPANISMKVKMVEAENARKEKRMADCVATFGSSLGSIVAHDSIALGMTADMCKAAWGLPWDMTKTKTATGINLKWVYSLNYELFFENGKLVRITH